MKSIKREITNGIELPKQERIRTLREKENYNYLWITEVDILKLPEMKKTKQKKTKQTNKQKSTSENEKASRKQTLKQEFHQSDPY